MAGSGFPGWHTCMSHSKIWLVNLIIMKWPSNFFRVVKINELLVPDYIWPRADSLRTNGLQLALFLAAFTQKCPGGRNDTVTWLLLNCHNADCNSTMLNKSISLARSGSFLFLPNRTRIPCNIQTVICKHMLGSFIILVCREIMTIMSF